MKKIILIFALAFASIFTTIGTYAETNESDTIYTSSAKESEIENINNFRSNIIVESSEPHLYINENIGSIMVSQLTDEEFNVLSNSDLYDFTMQSKNISDKNVIRIYHNSITFQDVKPLDDYISDYKITDKSNKQRVYLVLDENPYEVQVSKQLNTISVIDDCYALEISLFDKIISDLQKTFVFIDNEYNLQGLYFFESNYHKDGITVYLKTDKGVLVRYYEYYSFGDFQMFTEEEFIKYVKDYQNYLKTINDIRDENGDLKYADLKYGGGMSFTEFVSNHGILNNVQNKDSNIAYIIVILIAFFIVLSIISFLFFRNKGIVKIKKKKD